MDESQGVLVPLHRLDVPAPHLLPFAIGSFDSIGPLSRAAFPHRHTFYEIVLVTGGRGSHVVDLRRRPLKPPQLCVITPGQVHYWEGVSELNGWVILFDDAFLLAHPGDRDLLRALGEGNGLRLDEPGGGEHPEDAAELERVVTGMLREHAEQRPGMVSVLQAYLHILVVRASRLPAGRTEAGQPVAARPGPAALLSQRFARLLTGPGGATGQSVRDWAAELGVSVSHLNESVKAATGRTPGQLIRQAQVLEAKRLLASTSLTVGRVAREVGFTDAAYFCRFFRRETGTTPGEFRRDSGLLTAAPEPGPPSPGGNHHACRLPSIDAPQTAP